jgi:hypothetical protein
LFWGEQQPVAPFGCGGLYFFSGLIILDAPGISAMRHPQISSGANLTKTS